AGAKKCYRPNKLKLVCELNPDSKWSDGSAVTANHYVQAYQHVLDPAVGGPDVELLLSLKNAKKILNGKAKADTLGVRANSDFKLTFEFEEPDFEFEYKLVSMGLVPWKKVPDVKTPLENLYNGPYKITRWEKGKKVVFEPNPHFSAGRKGRPNIEILFVLEDMTALNLFENGTLSFLRRLPTMLIPKYKDNPAFLQKPFVRFDYVGFGPELMNQPDIRKALALSLDYEQLKGMLHALGRPGCPSVPESFLDKPRCFSFDVKEAKELVKTADPEFLKKRLVLAISQQGGDDIKRQAEWFQSQWSKNIGVQTEIQVFENKMHIQNLKVAPPAIFRKGVTLDRPTCLAALETFSKKNPENYVRFDDPAYEKIVEKLNSELAPSERKKLCGTAIQILLDSYRAIPMGRIHFTLLTSRAFKGWTLNELNQLDVADLYWDRTNH
ncbi:MAG: ABC transporter substrate-binding protein, partial [Bdellovibrionia bacterium]